MKKPANLNESDKDALADLIVRANSLVHRPNEASLEKIIKTLQELEPFVKRNSYEQHHMLSNAHAYYELLRKRFKEIKGIKYKPK